MPPAAARPPRQRAVAPGIATLPRPRRRALAAAAAAALLASLCVAVYLLLFGSHGAPEGASQDSPRAASTPPPPPVHNALACSVPMGVAVDAAGGNLFIADSGSHRILRLAARTGVVTTVAGTGAEGFSGDGGPGTLARLAFPAGVAVDGGGSLFIADFYSHRIRRVAAGSGVITTVAGTGELGLGGDGGPGTSARLAFPGGVTVAPGGDVFIADTHNHRIRRLAVRSGVVTTVAGGSIDGKGGFSGDGGPATSARLAFPLGVAVAADGDVFVTDGYNNRVRRVAADTGVITTVAGGSELGFSGDGGRATSARLTMPTALAFDAGGDLLIVDAGNQRIRRVAAGTGVITTVAGSGDVDSGSGAAEAGLGDGGPATRATLNFPGGVAVDGGGHVFIADTFNHRIRRLDAGRGVITTVTGMTWTDDAAAHSGARGSGAATSARVASSAAAATAPAAARAPPGAPLINAIALELEVDVDACGSVFIGSSSDVLRHRDRRRRHCGRGARGRAQLAPQSSIARVRL